MQRIIEGWPAWAAFLLLFAAALARGNAVYWAGRGMRSGGERSRWARHLDRPLVVRAEGWVRRWGPAVVTLGHLTVGVQTAITGAAGALRMPQRRFQPALVAGAAVWALLYTTVGLAVVDALLGRVPWWWLLVAAAVVLAVVVGSRLVRRRLELGTGKGR